MPAIPLKSERAPDSIASLPKKAGGIQRQIEDFQSRLISEEDAREMYSEFPNLASSASESVMASVPARPKRLCAALSGLRLYEEFGDMDGQRGGQLVQVGDRRIFEPSLDLADIGAIDVGIDGKLLLGNAPCHANPS